MGTLKAMLRKLVPGLTTAYAITLGTLSVSVVNGDLHWFGLGAAIRVGLPAFVVGALFFPVTEQSLASRLGFALRTGFAAAAACLVHRVLWTALRLGDGELPALGIDVPAVLYVLGNPATLLPVGSLDPTALMAMSAIAGASALGYLAQPILKRAARARRPSASSAIAQLSSCRAGTAPMVRTRWSTE